MALLCNLSPLSAETQRVIYPKPESEADKRFETFIALLQLALERTKESFGEYSIEPSDSAMTESRYLTELQSGKIVNVAWSSTSRDKERSMFPIRIPLLKGIIGYRICLIHHDSKKAFQAIKTLDNLQELRVGQGIGWGDVQIYNSNNFRISTDTYENLYAMLQTKRFHLFPRGINEVFTEYKIRKKDYPNIIIDQAIAIYYPFPYYFFVNLKNKKLAVRIQLGLEKMIEDGSFDIFFAKRHLKFIEQAQLDKRRIFFLKNNMLPKETPLKIKKYWYLPH